MAAKNQSFGQKTPVRPASTPVSTSPVRNTAIPKTPAKTLTHEQIARRAYEIYASGRGGTQTENWLRAERKLRNG